MFSNLFKKSDKPSAAVFVDYEHWYYGYNNIFSMKPNVQEWYDELTEYLWLSQSNLRRFSIMNMVDTLKGSYFSEVLPEGWDIYRKTVSMIRYGSRRVTLR